MLLYSQRLGQPTKQNKEIKTMNEMNTQEVVKIVERQMADLAMVLTEIKNGTLDVACTILYDVQFALKHLPQDFDRYLQELEYAKAAEEEEE